MIKIGFDGKRAANNLTGLGNYSRSLIEKLAKYFPENQYLVYTSKVKNSNQISSFFNLPSVCLRLPATNTLFHSFWRSFGIGKQLQQDGLQIYHGLSNEIPFQIPIGVKKVVTIHDLIFLKFPNHYGKIDRFIYTYKSKYACDHADLIIAISEKTKQDIIHYYQIPASKIRVCYQSCHEAFKSAVPLSERNAVLKKHRLFTAEGKPVQYLLNVGTIEARKNLLLIIKALPKINSAYKLVVIGKRQNYAKLVDEEIKKLGLSDRVIFLKNIPFNELPSIYQSAALFIYPSFYEGFGIPVIEAMYSQVPVIAATGSCLEEAGGPDSKYVDPNNSIELAASVNYIINSATQADKMISAGLNYLENFTSEKLSAQLMTAYHELLS